jgi:hypothetical protein
VPTIGIDYELTRDDLVAFQLYAMKNSRTAKRLDRRTRVTYAFVIVLMAALTSPWSSAIAVAGFLIGAITFLGLSWLFVRALTRRAFAAPVDEETLYSFVQSQLAKRLAPIRSETYR